MLVAVVEHPADARVAVAQHVQDVALRARGFKRSGAQEARFRSRPVLLGLCSALSGNGFSLQPRITWELAFVWTICKEVHQEGCSVKGCKWAVPTSESQNST